MNVDPLTGSPEQTRRAKHQLHAVLVRVSDTGVLLIGESGIGKSECALDLITRGHQLVADDAVEAFNRDGQIFGKAPALTNRLMEIRGLGVINIAEIFGEGAVLPESAIDLCIELRKRTDSDRLENVTSEFPIAGGAIPQFVLPVSPGRNLATLVETAVRIHRNGRMGKAAEKLIEDHARLLHPVQ